MSGDKYTEASSAHEHESALWLAVQKKHEGIVRLLLQYGSPELYSTQSTNLLVETAINSNLSGIVQVLLEHVNGGYVLDKCAELHLFQAAKLGFAEVVELLLKKGVNIHCKIVEMSQLHGKPVYESTGSEWGTTPLTVAAKNVKILLEKGARWVFKGDRTSLLVDAVQMGHANIVKIFFFWSKVPIAKLGTRLMSGHSYYWRPVLAMKKWSESWLAPGRTSIAEHNVGPFQHRVGMRE
ncbi:hypothetical protein ASPVEDRAFT_30022 [Aspergillus versicolor CBS 583.65]|uniref:Uncharacterized protein n=1 Tax=Aspergillus versicolor CBS 583.65 TaxID=1036611 RepID=A0A1L9PPQ8_ASPVE|nr:uncharacterized protein ASPVEDRAFT_30022 [Aspergillus versicolor CBS 583.65]OJJ03508.1 hypothetical protein ASPVEDRAFT_30022 [Aspergillus versicolor CBS 583.65]